MSNRLRPPTLLVLGLLLVGGCNASTSSPSPVSQRVFGTVTAVREGGELTIEVEQLFTDDAAASAAAEDGRPLFNPVYVRDLHRSLAAHLPDGTPVGTFPLGATGSAPVTTAVADFLAAQRACAPDRACGQFWFDIAGTEVQQVVEQRMP